MMHHKLFLCISFVSLLSVNSVHGEVDIGKILREAAQKVAEDAGTSLDQFALAGGLCFSAEDKGPGEIRCQDQAVGE